MSWLELFDLALCGRLCLTLMHSLWQIPLFALLAWTLSRILRCNSEWQYVCFVGALLLSLIALPITFHTTSELAQHTAPGRNASNPLRIEPAESKTASTHRPDNSVQNEYSNESLSDTLGSQAIKRSARPADRSEAKYVGWPASIHWLHVTPWVVALYVVIVLTMISRLAIATTHASRLGKSAQIIADGQLFNALQRLAAKWSMRAAPALAYSERVLMPTVVGLFKPVILLPAATVGGMTANELEMILAHELAHVRRQDMWVNLLQRLAESILFFNPALWYLSRRISRTREFCCDELTCRAKVDSKVKPQLDYVTALLRAAEIAHSSSEPASNREAQIALSALRADGGQSPSELRMRVARLLGEPIHKPLRLTRGGILAVLMLLSLAVSSTSRIQLSAADPNALTVASGQEFRLQIVDAQDEPVPFANVEIRTSPKFTADQIHQGSFLRVASYGTFTKADKDGILAVRLKQTPKRFNLSIMEPGFGPYWAGWDSADHPAPIPKSFRAQLDSAWSVGGVLVDSDGDPIVDASVSPYVKFKKRPGDDSELYVGNRIRTDAQGRWRFDHVPDSHQSIHVTFNHADFQPLRTHLDMEQFSVSLAVPAEKTIQMEQGLAITGTVTDDHGNPIQDAMVRTKFHNELREATTDEHGSYRIEGCEPRMTRVVVSAKGKALELKSVKVEPDMDPLDFALTPGRTLRVRFVDETGKGIPKAKVFFQRWRGPIDYFEFDHLDREADERGVWQWMEAPADEMFADIIRPDGMQLAYQKLVARDEEYVFHPPLRLVVSGSVSDATTGATVESFRVIPGQKLMSANGVGDLSWMDRGAYTSSDGTYETKFRRGPTEHFVRIEAAGYKVATSRSIRSDEGDVTFDFKLVPAVSIGAKVTTPDGVPATGAKVALGVAESQIRVKNGDLDDSSTYALRTTTDENGRFSFADREETYHIVIVHPTGFTHFKSSDGALPNPLELTAWSSVKGTFHIGSQLGANVGLEIWGGLQSFGPESPGVSNSTETRTNSLGEFEFPRVFPGELHIGRRMVFMVDDGATEVTSSVRMPITLQAGERTTIELGGDGRRVKGRLVVPPDHEGKAAWHFGTISGSQSNKRSMTATQFWSSIAKDGSFLIDDVPPGDYLLGVQFSQESPGVLAHLRRFTVASPLNKAPHELGDLQLKRKPASQAQIGPSLDE